MYTKIRIVHKDLAISTYNSSMYWCNKNSNKSSNGNSSSSSSSRKTLFAWEKYLIIPITKLIEVIHMALTVTKYLQWLTQW